MRRRAVARSGHSVPAEDTSTSSDLGIEFTTLSLAGRCERTGMLGVAIATSEMAVGSRCIHVVPGVGSGLPGARSQRAPPLEPLANQLETGGRILQ